MIVKICGTTDEDDALLAVAMGADMLGFIFAPSPRQIAPQQAADIVKRLPREIITVAVFRDEAPQRVVELTHQAGMGAAQLSGHESADQTAWIRKRVPIVIKGFAAGDPRIGSAADYGADVVHLDAAHPGSGKVFDWELAAAVPQGLKLMVAGGLTPDNVAGAIARIHPWGVDAVTGVEREPGRKDPLKLRAFIANAKAASPGEPTAAAAGQEAGGVYDWEIE